MSWNSSFFPFLRVALSNKYFHVGRYDLCCCCFGCILCVYHLYCSCTKTASAVILNSCSAGKSSFGLLWEPEIIFSEWNYFQISDQKWPTLTSYGVLTQPHFGDSAFRPFPLKKPSNKICARLNLVLSFLRCCRPDLLLKNSQTLLRFSWWLNAVTLRSK